MSTVEAARSWAGKLVSMEDPGNDREGALRRIEAKYGISYWTLWNLLYRAPKDIAAGKYQAIRLAYLDRCEVQIRRLQHEIEIERRKGAIPDDVVEDFGGEAAALARRLEEARARG